MEPLFKNGSFNPRDGMNGNVRDSRQRARELKLTHDGERALKHLVELEVRKPQIQEKRIGHDKGNHANRLGIDIPILKLLTRLRWILAGIPRTLRGLQARWESRI